MGSKYDVFWEQYLFKIGELLKEAYVEGTSSEMDVRDIKEFGERQSWYGVVEIHRNGIKEGEMAHAVSLGNVILDNNLLEPFIKVRFKLVINTDFKLRAERIYLAEPEKDVDKPHIMEKTVRPSSGGKKALILIPCGGDKNTSYLGDEVARPLGDIEAMRNEMLELLRATPELKVKEKNANGILADETPISYAVDLYQGKFYSVTKRILKRIFNGDYPSIHVLIVSAFYGLVQLDEGIKKYELDFLNFKIRRVSDSGVVILN